MVFAWQRWCVSAWSLLTIASLAINSVAAAEDGDADWGGNLRPFWVGGEQTLAEESPDSYAAFRGRFQLASAGEVEIRSLGASWFVAWLDGKYLLEGPARYPTSHPQYGSLRVKLGAGSHVLAFQVHHDGVSTRILDEISPFLACTVLQDGKPLAIDWCSQRLTAYEPEVRRLNPQLSWIEWCDTRQLPRDWQQPTFDDSTWQPIVACQPEIGKFEPVTLANVRSFVHQFTPIDSGNLAENFGYERDDEPARFFLRNLKCEKVPPQGVWRRYDLGRIRLARPRFVLDLPAGAIVEFAYCEMLLHGRVSPYINLSAGASCNLDHYVARGGRQEFFPLAPRGGRYVEIHVLADPQKISFIEEKFVERCYHGSPEGNFRCNEPLLERIWHTGIETYRACAEDALIDNPTRERGQWTGDVVSVGMDIAAAGYGDVRLIRRGLMQSGQSARDDGMVAGLCPGGEAYLTTYAAQWISACLHYWELTGDIELLNSAFPVAERNIEAFVAQLSDDGLADELGWGFVDWGYVRNDGPSDMAVNMHFLEALGNMVRWCDAIQQNARKEHYAELQNRVQGIVQGWIDQSLTGSGDRWQRIGYHRAVLGLRLGLFPADVEPACVDFIKSHMLRCFPNDASAPRNADPTKQESRLITPYFAHYAFPELLKRSEATFVFDQYRTCWGWALEDDRTTWVEVFDTRWSHCHQWAGCPTWQLSRYALGLHPRFDRGRYYYDFFFTPGDLQEASGFIPISGLDQVLEVQWQRQSEEEVSYRIVIPADLKIHVKSGDQEIEVRGTRQCTLMRQEGIWQVTPIKN
jgi:alpha-L-rhamnosidase